MLQFLNPSNLMKKIKQNINSKYNGGYSPFSEKKSF